MNAQVVLGLVVLVTGVLVAARGIRATGPSRAAWAMAILGAGAAGAGAFLAVNGSSGRGPVLPADPVPLVSWVLLPGGVGAVLRGSILVRRGASAAAHHDAPAGGPAAEATMSGADVPMSSADPGPVSFAGPEPAPDEPAPDPPRESFAELACDDVVVAGVPFVVTVGLRAEADPAVAGGPLRRPEASRGPWQLTVQLAADGFALASGTDRWRVDLEVTADDAYPTAALRLVARAADAQVVARTLRAMYLADGQPIGFAVRAVAVVAEASLAARTPAPPPAQAIALAPPTADAPADLTVRIEIADGPIPGRLLWQLLAADPSVVVPDAPMVVDIGSKPEAFLRNVIRQMTDAEGRPGLYQALRGIGRIVADQVPATFWEVLATVAERVGDRAVTVLLLSEEPYVPWELAVMETPLDAGAPPFLSAQVDLGRWVLAQRRPALPPPTTVEAASMAVVSGVYDRDPAWQRLLDAEAESAELVRRYRAVAVDAEGAPVLALLEGTPPTDVLHFAVHGQYDPGGTIDGLVLLDGPLDPVQVTGSDLAGHPFVFLNACQVGSGDAVLGDHAGMARAFLAGGAAAVVAPLWSIDDVTARELALRFYERTLAGASPAAALREERRAFRREPAPASSTMLAYQLFGHPRMRLRAAGPLASPVPVPGAPAAPGS